MNFIWGVLAGSLAAIVWFSLTGSTLKWTLKK